MKKLLLIGLMLCSMGAIAQQSAASKARALSHIKAELLKMKLPAPHVNAIDNGAPVNNITVPRKGNPTIQATANETIIGNTYYDLQTNNTISNRLVNNADGTLSAAWTFSPNNTSGYPDRGTACNYYDGSAWQTIPTVRIEGDVTRSGFTNIGVTETNQEVVMAHGIQPTGPSKGMLLTTRPSKGTGAWTVNDTVLGVYPADTIDLWPKMAVGGVDGKSIHALWRGGSLNNKIKGQTGPLFYSRSTDNGVTWDKLETIPHEIDSTYYLGFGGDDYSIDAKDSVVAFVIGGLGLDVILMKSTDNGSTWTKTIVNKFPIPFYDSGTMITDTNGDTVADTLWSGTGDPAVVIDNNHVAHVFFTACRVLGSTGTGLSYFPFTSELFYWNESMNTDSATFLAYAPDLDQSGQIEFPANNTSACPNDYFPFGRYITLYRVIEAPSAGVDANNNIYVCYQTVDELSDPSAVSSNFDKLFKHVYIIKSTDGGSTWTDYNVALDVVKETQTDPLNYNQWEGVYACMAKRVDSKVHIIYQRDFFPGVSLSASGSCDNQLNSGMTSDIVYVSIDTSLQSVVGTHELSNNVRGINVSANFPNPADDYTQFYLTLNSSVNVKVDVTDILGQNVYAENKGKLSAGAHLVTLNTAYLSAGVYFYTLTAGNEKVTNKMIVR